MHVLEGRPHGHGEPFVTGEAAREVVRHLDLEIERGLEEAVGVPGRSGPPGGLLRGLLEGLEVVSERDPLRIEAQLLGRRRRPRAPRRVPHPAQHQGEEVRDGEGRGGAARAFAHPRAVRIVRGVALEVGVHAVDVPAQGEGRDGDGDGARGRDGADEAREGALHVVGAREGDPDPRRGHEHREQEEPRGHAGEDEGEGEPRHAEGEPAPGEGGGDPLAEPLAHRGETVRHARWLPAGTESRVRSIIDAAPLREKGKDREVIRVS